MAKVYFGGTQENLTKKASLLEIKDIRAITDAVGKKKSKSNKDEQLDPHKAKKTKAWGAKLAPLFKTMAWLNKYQIYRPYLYIPYESLYAWGHLIGKAGLGASKAVQSKIRKSMRAFFPHAKPAQISKLVDASVKYQGGLLLDYMFNLPLTSDIPKIPYERFFRFTNPEVLNKTLEQNKGAIICVTHIGSFLGTMPGFTLNPQKWKLASVANLTNSTFYQYLISKPAWNNLYVYPSISFKQIGKYLEKHLRENRALIMFADYSMPSQLRVPLEYGKYPYLVHSVQSTIHLHRNTGAPLLVCIAHPDKGCIGRTRFEFIDNTAIMDASNKYWNAPDKEFHGRVSMEINKTMYPYIRKYAHVWEEIQNFACMRLADYLKLPANLTHKEFLSAIQQKMIAIIDGSWEPDRKDQEILNEINTQFPKAINALQSPNMIFLPHKSKVNLSMMNGLAELITLSTIAITQLKKKGEITAALAIETLKNQLKSYIV
jgi:lauroyl/myristoyl acyltransferase